MEVYSLSKIYISMLLHYSWTKKPCRITKLNHNNILPGEIPKFNWENFNYISTPTIRLIDARNLYLVL